MKIFCLVVFLLAEVAVTAAQENAALHPIDTLTLKSLVFPGPTNSLSSPSFLPPMWLYDTTLTRDFPSSYLGYALTSESAVPDKRIDLSWQMGINRSPDDPLKSLRMVLGAVSAGGAAYIAYQHIRKYGFLK